MIYLFIYLFILLYFQTLHAGPLTPMVLQKMNEYYANVTFILKQANKLKQDLRLRANAIDVSGYILLNDMKAIMCRLHDHMNDISLSDIGNTQTDIIVSPCVGMSRDTFFMSAIRILHNFRRFTQTIIQQWT